MSSSPHDPLHAVTHPDPYPYYAELARTAPFERCASIGMWVAAGPAAIREVLAHPSCRVRPAAEPVPHALVGSPAGELFSQFARMNDGDRHRVAKARVSAALEIIELDAVRHVSAERARALLTGSELDPLRATRFMFELSTHVFGTLFGVDAAELPALAEEVGSFARMLAPNADAQQIARGQEAAVALIERFGRGRGRGRDAADRIGILAQAYLATAGLIGNVLVALGRGSASGEELGACVERTSREDPPVQNTRRFVTERAQIAGRSLEAGEVIVVLLAGGFAFGHESHRCPGSPAAKVIAEAGVRRLLECDARPDLWIGGMSYQPSSNTRVPLFSRIPSGR